MLISFHNLLSDVQLHCRFLSAAPRDSFQHFDRFTFKPAFYALMCPTFWYQFTLFDAHAIILQALFCSRGMDLGDDTGTHILSLGEVRCEVSVWVI